MSKLVRDKIPEIIQNENRDCETRVVSGKEYYLRLKDKLDEEVDEFLEDDSIEELADIYEVLEAIVKLKCSFNELEKVKEKKKEERGGFEKGVILERIN